MKKSTGKELSATPHRPARWLYNILVPLAMILSNTWIKAKYIKDPAIKKRKGPFVVIGTHTCIMDVALMTIAMRPVRLNIVCGRDVFTWSKIKPIKNSAGLIPINQFEMDLGSIRMMKRAVDAGCSLALFPEGKFTLDGKPLHYLPESLAKLLKLLKADVVFCHNYGGYCARPRWYKGFKYGVVTNKSELLFTKEQLGTMSDKEIYAVLQGKFQFNDNLYQQENKLRYKCKDPALGLHYILYKCPKCGKEYTMTSDAHYLTCENCGNKVEYTEYGELVPQGDSVSFERIDLWYDYERRSVREEISRPDFCVSHPVVWEQNDATNTYREIGEGELYINDKVIGFKGTRYDNGEEAVIEVPLVKLSTIVHKNYEAVDLTIDTVVNRFYFREGKYSAKYNLIVEEKFRQIKGLPIE